MDRAQAPVNLFELGAASVDEWCSRFYARVVKNGTLVTSGMPHLYDRPASGLPFRGRLLKDFAAEYFGEIPEEFADRRFPPVRPPLLDPADARDAALIAECDKIMAAAAAEAVAAVAVAVPYLGPAAVVPGPAPGPVLVVDEDAKLSPAEYMEADLTQPQRVEVVRTCEPIASEEVTALILDDEKAELSPAEYEAWRKRFF